MRVLGWKQGRPQLKTSMQVERWEEEQKTMGEEKRSRRSAFALLWSSSKVNIPVAYSTSLVSITVMMRYHVYVLSLDKEQTFKNVTLAQEHTSGGMFFADTASNADLRSHSNTFLNRPDLCRCDPFKQKETRNTENGRNRKRVERWECCSLGCRLGGGAWKRPCHGLPLVESAQYPSNHPAPSLSSLPSVNIAGEQEMV